MPARFPGTESRATKGAHSRMDVQMVLANDFGSYAARLAFPPGFRLGAYHELATRLEAGMPLPDALNAMGGPGRGIRRAVTARAAREWGGRVARGMPLSEAVSGWVPRHDEFVLRVSEEAGDVVSGIHNAAFLIDGQMAILRRAAMDILPFALLGLLAAAWVATRLGA
jgi:hypothetical protein